MGMINVSKLDAELKSAGIPIHGCASTGRIDFTPEATEEHRALAAQILAAHDPTPPYGELRAKEFPTTDALIVALWESVVEGRTDSVTALEQARQAVKARYPKG